MKTLFAILGLGLLNGSRTFAALALLANRLSENPPPGSRGLPAWLARPWVARALKLMATGELVGDKVPGIPARTEPQALVGRGTMGALAGATVAALTGGITRRSGALLGGAAAIVGAFIGYTWRKRTVEERGVPDFVVALVEDAVVVAGGAGLTAWVVPEQVKHS
jgi:uncharacterized membrane protein